MSASSLPYGLYTPQPQPKQTTTGPSLPTTNLTIPSTQVSSSCPIQKEVATLKGHTGSVLCVKFNGEGTYCMSGGTDKSLRLWNPHSAKLIKSYLGHGWEVLDVA